MMLRDCWTIDRILMIEIINIVISVDAQVLQCMQKCPLEKVLVDSAVDGLSGLFLHCVCPSDIVRGTSHGRIRR
jgi:hypothetical protein